MIMGLRLISVYGLVLVLSACGGGGSDTSNPPVDKGPTPAEIIASATKYSKTQLQAAAKKIVDTSYSGAKTNATLDVELTQLTFVYLFGESAIQLPEITGYNFQNQISSFGNFDVTANCDIQGTVNYKGSITDKGIGNISLNFNNCHQYENDFPITGKAAIAISEVSETTESISVYFDRLSWLQDKQAVKLSGYSSISLQYNDTTYRYTVNSDQYVMFNIDNQELLVDSAFTIDGNDVDSAIDFNGDVYFKDKGKINVSFADVSEFPPYIYAGSIVFKADKQTALEFGNTYVRYVEDTDANGSYDVGTYFSGLTELLTLGNAGEKQVVALSELSLPPYVNSPYFYYYSEVFTADSITVTPGYYEDPDTANENLTVGFRWYLNDELLVGQNSHVLPPFTAVFGDKLEVTMVVSDGPNVIESEKTPIHISDSPIEFKTSNVPNLVHAGDMVKFVAELYDPDQIEQNSTASILKGAPEGATMDANGVVNWQVPSDMMFVSQSYTFTFALPDVNGQAGEEVTLNIDAVSDKAFPITRSGITVPQVNNSMWVGDFNGDGLNEVLSTDNIGSVFLLEHKDNRYQQTWVYPFKLPTQGSIRQLLAFNIDDDASLEVLVITQHGISVINGLDNLASVLTTTDNYIHSAAIADVDHDGVAELAYLTSSSEYSSSNITLKVLKLDKPDTVVFETNVAEAKQIIFANVDLDANLELIINNGLVYDAVTWANQWLSGNSFGDSLVTAGDYNNDGVDEIAGANTWGTLSLYSAVTKSQLASLDNFNTCTLYSANIDQDSADELLVGDCQWGNVTVYKLTDNTLTEHLQIDLQDHGSTSLTAGDSDNDGKLELHWGSGVSSSGEDIFVTANIDGDAISVMPESKTIQLDSYSSAGWSNISEGQDRAVFFIPSSGSGYNGSRIALIDDSGQLELSPIISSNWDNSNFATTTDYNKDGLGDIFIPATVTYDGAFAAVQLNDFSIQWQTNGSYDSDIGLVKAFDINADSFDDAVYLDAQILKAIDVTNQVVIANYTFNLYPNDFVVFRENNTSYVIASGNDRLIYLALNGTAFSELAFVQTACSRIELINIDTDMQQELLCLQESSGYNSTQTLIVYELNNNNFTEKARYPLTSKVIDMHADPTSAEQQNIFITTSYGNSYSYWDNTNIYQVKKLNATAKTIWSSPGLIGQPSSHGMRVRQTENGTEMMLSTNRMMYWIK